MLEKIRNSILAQANRNAFIIKDKTYSYHDFARCITGIRQLLRNFRNTRNNIVGVYTEDSIETYAAIYAIWFEGMTFLPLNPRFPDIRNQEIIKQTGTNILLFQSVNPPSSVGDLVENLECIKGVVSDTVDLSLNPFSDDDILYILFTSGSTGIPKGVPISRKNFRAFIDAFLENGYMWNEDDRFLQMFDFTFDVSVQCYTVPLLFGACICTVPHEGIKYLSVYKVFERHSPTVAIMVPSVLIFLRPYLKKIHLPDLRYTLFTGESVPVSIVEAWSRCCPNAVIDDCYGPTEATIYCLSYRWCRHNGKIKSYNGIVSIGKPFMGVTALVADDKNKPVPAGVKGELLIAGDQVTKGYLNDEEKNLSAFVTVTLKDKKQLFYRTGDLVFVDEQGDYMYCGRTDYQVQVHGFRVELGEIEYRAKHFMQTGNCVALARPNKSGNMEIFLFAEGNRERIPELMAYLQSALPYYMQPVKIIPVDAMPLNEHGKTDRKALIALME
ncbi:MAG: amino acid adenylation domain-containing protein [Bacteroidales bacterium]|nr:amino acid adenylation domain-containing protein [Bacteroidales bacterium]